MSFIPQIARRQAREIAFQFLYGNLPDAGKPHKAFTHTDFELFFKNFTPEYGEPDEFAWELVEGAGKNMPTLDEAISKLSTNWRIERMPRVDLTILRLASFEILHRPDVPKTVSINEAVELAKSYGSEDSAAFVNGILDKITKPS